MRQMPGFNELRQQRRMSWIAQQHGWVAVPEEIVSALSNEGFEECTRELTTSRPDRLAAGGLWQGFDPRTGSVASATWVNRPAWHYSLVFIEVDGESLTSGEGVRGKPGSPSGRARQDPTGPPTAQRQETGGVGKRTGSASGNGPASVPDHGGEQGPTAVGAHAVSGGARREAFDHAPRRQSREDDRRDPTLERDLDHDEGGEG
jgi:hypothetical protein